MAQRNLKNNPIIRRRINANREVIEQNRMRLGLEKTLRKQLIKVLDTVFRVAAGEIKRHGTVENTLESIEERLRKVLEPHYRKTIIMFSERAEEGLLTKGKTRFQTHIDDFIAKEGAEKVTQITAATRRQVQKIVADGATRGAGEAAIARDLRKKLGFSAKRAATIARTETHNAAVFANDAIDRESRGAEFTDRQKRWVSVADERTRSHHARMNGVEVGVDEAFKVPYKGNIYSMQRPGDPAGRAANVINCRCVLVYIDGETDLLHIGQSPDGTRFSLPADGPLSPLSPLSTAAPRQPAQLRLWSPDATPEEIEWLQIAFTKLDDAELLAVVRNGGAPVKINYNGSLESSYNFRTKEINLRKPISEFKSPKDRVRSIRVFVHEKFHAIDDAFDANGVRTHHSAANTFNMEKDLKKFYSKNDASNRSKAALKEWEELEGTELYRLPNGSFGTRPTIFAKDIKAAAANLKGTGMDVDDLIELMPGLARLEDGLRFNAIRRASIYIKHRDFDGLRNLMTRVGSGDGALGFSSDFMAAISRGKVGDGHTASYWDRGSVLDRTGYKFSHVIEAFAEYGALRTGPNSKQWLKILRHFAPESVKGFDNVMTELAKGPRRIALTAADIGG